MSPKVKKLSKREQDIINIHKAIEKAKFKEHQSYNNTNKVDYNAISTTLDGEDNETGGHLSRFSEQTMRLKQVDYWGCDDGDLGYDEHGEPIRSLYIEEFDHVEIDYYPKSNVMCFVSDGIKLSDAFIESIFGRRWKAWFGESYEDGSPAETDDIVYLRNQTFKSDYAIYKLDDVGYSPEKYKYANGNPNMKDLLGELDDEDEDDDYYFDDDFDDEPGAKPQFDQFKYMNGELVGEGGAVKEPKIRIRDGHIETYEDDDD